MVERPKVRARNHTRKVSGMQRKSRIQRLRNTERLNGNMLELRTASSRLVGCEKFLKKKETWTERRTAIPGSTRIGLRYAEATRRTNGNDHHVRRNEDDVSNMYVSIQRLCKKLFYILQRNGNWRTPNRQQQDIQDQRTRPQLRKDSKAACRNGIGNY